MQRHNTPTTLLPLLLLRLFLFLRLASASSSSSSSTTPAAAAAAAATPRVEVVLVGATSSLARKYLFQSFFRAYLEEELKPSDDPTKFRLHLYGGATRGPEEGVRLLGEYLEGSTSCKGLDDTQGCEAALGAYRAGFEYVQLRGEAQYAELGRRLKGKEGQEKGGGGEPLGGRCVGCGSEIDGTRVWCLHRLL
jgi:hypothetical protein